MKSLVERYESFKPHEVDYDALLEDTDVFRGGKNLTDDPVATRRIGVRLAEAEAALDISAAIQFLTEGRLRTPAEMKVGCELEYWAFFEPNHFSRVLYVGSGACPMIAIYVLERDSDIVFDGIDIVPHASVLCSQLAAKMGYSRRLRASTQDGLELEPERLQLYDGFFISSAVPPKNQIIERLLKYKQPKAKIYAREDAAHPQFYPVVEVTHPDLMTGDQARELWRKERKRPPPGLRE
jgi:hypothetical protein